MIIKDLVFTAFINNDIKYLVFTAFSNNDIKYHVYFPFINGDINLLSYPTSQATDEVANKYRYAMLFPTNVNCGRRFF